MTLEICAQSIESCVNAQKGGAWRIELCQALELGGLTPGSGLIQLAKNYLTIPIHVLIRPRVGDFVYSRMEMESIQLEIDNCKAMGAEGVVIGFLDEDGDIDQRTLERLVHRAAPMDVTFHRAFDCTRDMRDSLEILIDSGCVRVLTSGGAATCMEGIEQLKSLVEQSNDRIQIMAGSGVNPDNIPDLFAAGIRDFHMSGSVEIEGVPSEIIPGNYFETDLDEVKRAKGVIKGLRKET